MVQALPKGNVKKIKIITVQCMPLIGYLLLCIVSIIIALNFGTTNEEISLIAKSDIDSGSQQLLEL